MENNRLQEVIDLNSLYKPLDEYRIGEKETEVKEEITVFLSYDISDSTRFKSLHPHEWANVIAILLDAQKDFQLMDFWKFNGDEILFKCTVYSIDFLCKLIERAFSQLEFMHDKMQESIKNIALKGTIWIALTCGELREYQSNYRFIIKENIDFSGKNIDEGFRLTKCSSMKKIAIDPKIVYILLDGVEKLKSHSTSYSGSERELERNIINILGKISFVGDVCCKGVWDDRPYPIYWYFERDEQSGIRYGEFLNGVHLWNKQIKPIYDVNDDRWKIEKSDMKKMFLQVNAKEDVTKIIEKLTHFGEPPNRASAGKANLYFMVVCINPNSGSVLIAQRSSTRKHLKGVWDFGNVKYQNIAMEEIIKSKYKSLFGIDISLSKDTERDNSIRPYSYCTIYRNNLPHNGIMFYATIQTQRKSTDEQLINRISKVISKDKDYQKVMFISPKMIEDNKLNFEELSLDEIKLDSKMVPENKDYSSSNKGIMHFSASIKDAMKKFDLEKGCFKNE